MTTVCVYILAVLREVIAARRGYTRRTAGLTMGAHRLLLQMAVLMVLSSCPTTHSKHSRTHSRSSLSLVTDGETWSSGDVHTSPHQHRRSRTHRHVNTIHYPNQEVIADVHTGSRRRSQQALRGQRQTYRRFDSKAVEVRRCRHQHDQPIILCILIVTNPGLPFARESKLIL